MHVALIVNEERLIHEHPTLNRISIGLMADGVQLTRIVPEDMLAPSTVEESEERIALAACLPAPMRVLPWTRADRRNRIIESLERSPPDVFYAMGDESWDLAHDLASNLDRAVAIDVWSASQIRRVPRGRRAVMVAGYITPTAPIADALRQRVDPNLVCHVAMGVAVPARPRSILENPDDAIALAILGGGRNVRAYQALLSGLVQVIDELPQIQVFLELRGPNEHEIWRHARRLNLLENVSAIANATQHRSLLTRCDMIVRPERYGELSSLMLEAMAYGMPIVTRDDPFLDMLEDGRTAAVVDADDAKAWTERIAGLLRNPSAARALGLAGRARIEEKHRSSDHVEHLRQTLERIGHGGSYRFDPDEEA